MSTTTAQTSTPTSASETRLDLANRLFHDFHASCFWHLRPNLSVTEAQIPLIVKGLRTHGGRDGVLAAAQLLALGASSESCR
jgi:hypothetical protein